jgi:hypothetical protein
MSLPARRQRARELGPDSRPRRRLPALGVVAAILLVAVILPAAGGIAAWAVETRLTGELRVGQSGLNQGKSLLTDGYKRQDPGMVARAANSFAASLGHFQDVSRQADGLRPATNPSVPRAVRSRVASLAAVVQLGIHADQAGLTASRALLDTGLVAPPSQPPPAAIGSDRLIGYLGSIRQELAAAEQAGAGVDAAILPSSDRAPFTRALVDLRLVNRALDQLWPSLPQVLDLAGFNGPRTFLVEQTNPAELRAGGGFIGTVSLVRADAGHVKLDKSLPVEAFDYCDAAACVRRRPQPWQPGYVAPPPELAGPPLPPQSRLTAWSLEDSGFYPDFASNAVAAESFANRLLNVKLDGVIAIDFYAVAPLLQVTGPIALPEYRMTLTASSFVDQIVGLDLARDPNHKNVISAAAAKIVSSLSHVQAGDVTRLLQVVVDQVRNRHLQVYFNNPAIQAQAARLGFTDSLNPRHAADFMLETEDNYGGSKADYFVERRYTMALSRTGSQLHHRVTIDLTDRAPADKPWIGPHYYAYVRLYVPAAAQGLAVRSTPSAEYAPVQRPARSSQVAPQGSQTVGGWIFVLVGIGLSGHYQVTFEYSTPWAPGPDGVDTVYWQKQPGTVHDAVTVTWDSGSHRLSTTGRLTGDSLLRLSDGALMFEQAPLQ